MTRPKRKTKHLDFYNECIKLGSLPKRNGKDVWSKGYYEVRWGGLCYAARAAQISEKLFELIKPTCSERTVIIPKHQDHTWWGSNSINEKRGVLTPLRQNIILLMAAMRGEL